MIKFKSLESLGMFFAVMAYFSFSLLDAVQKTAIIYHSVFQLLFIKYCFVLILSLIESQRKKFWMAGVAQLVERWIVIPVVEGSNPFARPR